jgi:hypothetical protein
VNAARKRASRAALVALFEGAPKKARRIPTPPMPWVPDPTTRASARPRYRIVATCERCGAQGVLCSRWRWVQLICVARCARKARAEYVRAYKYCQRHGMPLPTASRHKSSPRFHRVVVDTTPPPAPRALRPLAPARSVPLAPFLLAAKKGGR